MHLLLPYFIIFIVILHYVLKKGTRSHAARNEAFLEREARANEVRRKDISNLNYISISENLPVINSGNDTFDTLIGSIPELKRSYEQLQELRDKKILNLTGISNTDLKLEYGVANLTVLSEYDDNFTSLVKCIAKIGHILSDNSDYDDAQIYLEYGISIGTDITSNYIDLARIYAACGNTDAIYTLKEKASALNSLSRDIIIGQLDQFF